jgi:ribosome-associated protein
MSEIVVNLATSPVIVASQEERGRSMALAAAQTADDRKGVDITVLQVTAVSYLADYFVIVTGFSPVQVKAIARAIEDALAESWDCHPLRTEGKAEGRWILQDYGDLIVHIFMPQEREFYNLEAFWNHAEQIPFEPRVSSL